MSKQNFADMIDFTDTKSTAARLAEAHLTHVDAVELNDYLYDQAETQYEAIADIFEAVATFDEPEKILPVLALIDPAFFFPQRPFAMSAISHKISNHSMYWWGRLLDIKAKAFSNGFFRWYHLANALNESREVHHPQFVYDWDKSVDENMSELLNGYNTYSFPEQATLADLDVFFGGFIFFSRKGDPTAITVKIPAKMTLSGDAQEQRFQAIDPYAFNQKFNLPAIAHFIAENVPYPKLRNTNMGEYIFGPEYDEVYKPLPFNREEFLPITARDYEAKKETLIAVLKNGDLTPYDGIEVLREIVEDPASNHELFLEDKKVLHALNSVPVPDNDRRATMEAINAFLKFLYTNAPK